MRIQGLCAGFVRSCVPRVNACARGLCAKGLCANAIRVVRFESHKGFCLCARALFAPHKLFGLCRFFFDRFISKILLSLTRLHYETTFKTHMDAFFIPIF